MGPPISKFYFERAQTEGMVGESRPICNVMYEYLNTGRRKQRYLVANLVRPVGLISPKCYLYH